MTTNALTEAAQAIPEDAVVSLKLSRADLINQVVADARDRHREAVVMRC